MKVPLASFLALALLSSTFVPLAQARKLPDAARRTTFPSKRFVVVLFDESDSFKRHRTTALQKLREIVAALGATDQFLFITIGPSFKPADNVKVECRMPDLQQLLLNPAKTLSEYESRQRDLNLLWRAVAQKQSAILRYFDEFSTHPTADGSEVWLPLAYAAHRLAEADGYEKFLFAVTDLSQSARGIKSDKPPTTGEFSFQGVQVKALFVPWQASGVNLRSWEQFFIQHGAQGFSAHDPAASKTQQLLPPSAVPKKLRPPS